MIDYPSTVFGKTLLGEVKHRGLHFSKVSAICVIDGNAFNKDTHLQLMRD